MYWYFVSNAIKEWKCDNSEKINITRECNGFPDCSDGSDEKGCGMVKNS